VRALKFRGALPLADLMAAHMAANLPAALRAPGAALVPVPPQRARRRRRGFDPADALAAALARRLERPLVRCLRRGDHAARERGAVGAGARRTVLVDRAERRELPALVGDDGGEQVALRALAAQ